MHFKECLEVNDMTDKGPYDRIAELQQKQVELQKRIKNGESGDGLKKPDLHAQLQVVQGELGSLLKSNPERRLYPTMPK